MGVGCILKGECGTCSRMRKHRGPKYARRPNAQMEFIKAEIVKIITKSPMSNYQIWHYLNFDKPGAKIVVSRRTVDTICRKCKDIRKKPPVYVKQKLGINADPKILAERDSTDNAYSNETDSEGNDTRIISFTTSGGDGLDKDGTAENQSNNSRSEHEFHREQPINCGELGIVEGISRKKRYTRLKSKSHPLTKEEILLLWELRKRRNQADTEKRFKKK
jgi:hypothetical protein